MTPGQWLAAGRAVSADVSLLKWLWEPAEVAYVGWAARGNVGDDLIFGAHRARLRGRSVLRAPLHRPGRQMVSLAKAPEPEVMLLGGGTLLFRPEWLTRIELAAEVLRPKRIIAFGVGAEEPAWDSDHQLWRAADTRRWHELLQRFDFVGVRGPRTQRVLRDVGVDSEVVGDPVLCVPMARRSARATGRLALNLVNGDGGYRHDQEAYFGALRSMVRDWLQDRGAVEVFGMERGDLSAARLALGPLATQVTWNRTFTGRSIARLVGAAELVVAERLHACILAANLGSDFVHIAYKPKSWDFLESIGAEANGLGRHEASALTDLVGNSLATAGVSNRGSTTREIRRLSARYHELFEHHVLDGRG